jgi:copper homeostasis protein CutC
MEADLDWINLHPKVDTILTSGGASKALEGIEGILKIKSIFHGHVMAAGKITAEVLPALHDQLQLHWYHGRAIV